MVTHVSTDQLAESVHAVRTDLNQAVEAPIATFTINSVLKNGFETRADIRQFSLTVDEPESLGGSDQGPTPVELVLSALGTCQEIVYATYARVLNIPIDRVAVRVEGRLDPRGFFGVTDVAAGFHSVAYAVDIESQAAPEEISRLIATVNAHCPVLDILREPVPVTGSYTHNGQTADAAATPDPVFLHG